MYNLLIAKLDGKRVVETNNVVSQSAVALPDFLVEKGWWIVHVEEKEELPEYIRYGELITFLEHGKVIGRYERSTVPLDEYKELVKKWASRNTKICIEFTFTWDGLYYTLESIDQSNLKELREIAEEDPAEEFTLHFYDKNGKDVNRTLKAEELIDLYKSSIKHKNSLLTLLNQFRMSIDEAPSHESILSMKNDFRDHANAKIMQIPQEVVKIPAGLRNNNQPIR